MQAPGITAGIAVLLVGSFAVLAGRASLPPDADWTAPVSRPARAAPFAPTVAAPGIVAATPSERSAVSPGPLEIDAPVSSPAESPTPDLSGAAAIHGSDPLEIAFALPEMDPRLVRQEAERVLDLTAHPDRLVREGAVRACRHLLDRADVRRRLLDAYAVEIDPQVRSAIAHIWQDRDLERETSIGFLLELWGLDESSDGRWRILDSFCRLGGRFPPSARSALEGLVAAGLPAGEPPGDVAEDVAGDVRKILDHGSLD